MYITVFDIQNAFSAVEFKYFQIYNQRCIKIFWKANVIKAPVGSELMTHKFVVNGKTHCAKS